MIVKMIGLFLSGVNVLNRHQTRVTGSQSYEAPAAALEGPCQLRFLLLGRKGQDESEIGKSLLGKESYFSFPGEKSDSVIKLIFSSINCLLCK